MAQTFTFYIRDTRYSVPTIAFVTAPDEAAARALAEERLLQSRHHTAVDVYGANASLFTVQRKDASGDDQGRFGEARASP